MIEQHIDIPTADGAMNSFVVQPEAVGPHPLVLFFMDALGKREELHTMARRLAAVGYCVVLPNLYYRQEREFFVLERTDPLVARMMELMQSLTNARVVQDALAVVAWADAQSNVDAQRVGAVGYCMSGPFVMAAAAALPGRMKAIAAFHPALMVTDQAIHRICWHPRFAAKPTWAAPRPTSGYRARWPPPCKPPWWRAAHRTAWSSTQAPSTALCFQRGLAFTTWQRPSVTGSGCLTCWGAICR